MINNEAEGIKSRVKQPDQPTLQEQLHEEEDTFPQHHRRGTPKVTQLSQEAIAPAYLVPKITKTRLKPIEPDKRLRSKIFSNHEISLDIDKHDSGKFKIQNVDLTARSPALSKVRSKMYSHIEESYQTEERKTEEMRFEGESDSKPFLTPQDFM